MHRRAKRSPGHSRELSGDDRQMAMPSQTIAAISSPHGEGAIALVRISGPEAIDVADCVFRGKQKPSQFRSHLQHLGEVVASEGGTEGPVKRRSVNRDSRVQSLTASVTTLPRVIDQAVVSVHRAPHSYTGEDLVEISCHGGVLVTADVLGACLSAGARAARPGEFTERAFLNRKMDLTQAEAVIDLIRAQTDLALRSATEQLEGRLGRAIEKIRDDLIVSRAHIEAAIDFSEEDIAPDEGEKLRGRFVQVREKIGALLATEQRGRIWREGLRVVIYGATNAGKSSLLNRLLGYERAIVSHIPGTTRDAIEETINLGGVPLRLLDTAGLRDSDDELEQAGMARTEKSLAVADLALHIVDSNAPRPPNFRNHASTATEILLLNKSDLPMHADWRNSEGLRISCVAENGLAGLEEQILARIGAQHIASESALAINARHRDCLRRALEACDRTEAALEQQFSLEIVAVEARDALDAVTEVISLPSDDPILDSLFSQFCIGK